MSFSKYVSLLEQRALYLARADVLAASDPFEGSTTQRGRTETMSVMKAAGLPPEAIERNATAMAKLTREALGQTFVNCWTWEAHESIALWRIYAPGSEGVAICSSFDQLTASVAADISEIYAGVVRHIDYASDLVSEGNLLAKFVHKRIGFEHEKELRLVLSAGRSIDGHTDPTPWPERGRFVKADLDVLLKKVVVSPASSAAFVQLVQSVTRRYGLETPVSASALSAEPTY